MGGLVPTNKCTICRFDHKEIFPVIPYAYSNHMRGLYHIKELQLIEIYGKM